MKWAEIAERANVAIEESAHTGAPFLSEDSPVSTLVRWLKWNDGNGEYDSADCDLLSVEEAWELIEEQTQP